MSVKIRLKVIEDGHIRLSVITLDEPSECHCQMCLNPDEDSDTGSGSGSDYEPELCTIPISQVYIKCRVLNLTPVCNHPYYLAIAHRDAQILETYTQQCHETHRLRETGYWEGFHKLYLSLGKRFKPWRDPIIVKLKGDKYVCKHGRHRMCLLAYIHPDKNLVIDTKSGIVENII